MVYKSPTTLKLKEKFRFYTPLEQGAYVNLDDEFIEQVEAKLALAVQGALSDFKDDYNEILEANLKEIFSEDEMVTLRGSTFEITLGDEYANSLTVDLQIVVDNTIEYFTDDCDDDDLDDIKKTIEFFRESADRLEILHDKEPNK